MIATGKSLLPMSATSYPVRMFYRDEDVGHHATLGFGQGFDSDSAGNLSDILMYFPGSGTTDYNFGPVFERWVAEGPNRAYMTTVWSGTKGDPQGRITTRPARFGYGNVNSPHFTSGFCKSAHHVRALVELTLSIPTVERVTLFGHSAGATGILGYLAGYAGEVEYDERITGAFINAPTQAGLGTGSWNNPARLTNSFSQMFGQKLGKRVLVSYADNDLYAPPDMARRYQACVPDDAETYFVSAGMRGHSWTGLPENTDLVMQWLYQVHNRLPFTLEDGVTLAKAGTGHGR